jgi:hypothetical protein
MSIMLTRCLHFVKNQFLVQIPKAEVQSRPRGRAPRSNPVTEARKELWVQARSRRSFAWNAAMIIFNGIGLQVADFVFEAMNMTQYNRNGDFWWLALTLGPIFLPGLVFGVYKLWEDQGCKDFAINRIMTIFFPICPIIM